MGRNRYFGSFCRATASVHRTTRAGRSRSCRSEEYRWCCSPGKRRGRVPLRRRRQSSRLYWSFRYVIRMVEEKEALKTHLHMKNVQENWQHKNKTRNLSTTYMAALFTHMYLKKGRNRFKNMGFLVLGQHPRKKIFNLTTTSSNYGNFLFQYVVLRVSTFNLKIKNQKSLTKSYCTESLGWEAVKL